MFKTQDEIRKAVDGDDVYNLEDMIDGSDYDGGMIEDLDRTQAMVVKFLAGLTRLMLNKGLITKNEAIELYTKVQ